MTFEQRMAELGVDLSDLRTDYSDEEYGQVFDTYLKWGEELEGASYILRLVEIIDRMETRLVNLTGERDWLKDVVTTLNLCETCGAPEDGCDSCPDWPQYEYSGVPEDWRPNDD